MSVVKNLRRYALLERLNALEVLCDDAIASMWLAKQEAEPGTPLPPDFPHRDRLVASGYSAIEDLDGADECELGAIGLSSRDAQAVLAAAFPNG